MRSMASPPIAVQSPRTYISDRSNLAAADGIGARMDHAVNDLLEAYERVLGGSSAEMESARGDLVARYGFAVPTEEALEVIRTASPQGVVEIGAGTGYWARLLHDRRVEVAAYDLEPPPSATNPWFAGSEPWHRVERGDHTAVDRLADRTLLLVWPTKNETWPSDALDAYYDAGGTTVAYVGEGPGGHTGDDVFHARLGLLTTCVQCTYGSTTCPCICGIHPRWRRTQTVALPHWPGFCDDLHLFVRTEQADRRPRRLGRPRVAGRREGLLRGKRR